jgi:hypothetical protein
MCKVVITLPLKKIKTMANAFQIQNAEYVEVVIPTGNTKQTIYFPDLPNLRNKPVFGIEAYTALEQATTTSGNSVQASADFPNATITLYYDGGEFIVVPLESLRRVVNKANTSTYGDIPTLAGQNIVWTKSYVSMNASVANFAGKSFLFNVYYRR